MFRLPQGSNETVAVKQGSDSGRSRRNRKGDPCTKCEAERELIVRIFVLCLLCWRTAILANDLYVAPTGTPSGPGTQFNAFDLATALSGTVGQPGDTFWLTGGTYNIGHIDTQIQGAPGQPITFRSLSGEWARVDGSLSFFSSSGNVILRDFELFSSDTNRASAQTNAGFAPTDISIIPGIASYVPNLSFINLVVHDETRHGFYISQSSSNNLIYGCLIYNNGWYSPDNAEGHGIYGQGTNDGQLVADNIVFNNAGAGLHIYEDDTNFPYLAGFTLDGNVAFNAGVIQTQRFYRDWVVGVDAPGLSADRMLVQSNMGYFNPLADQETQMQIGREGVNGTVTIFHNYLPAGLQLNNWTWAVVIGNVLAAQTTNFAVQLNQTNVPLTAYWNRNAYGISARSIDFLNDTNALDFAGWQSFTGYDLDSTCGAGGLSGTQVFIRPNRYEVGRANIVVYNWAGLSNVVVDVSSVVALGSPYEVRNAEDCFAAPVLVGVFDGRPLSLPMTGLTVAVPNGPMVTPQPTGPTFNVFVLRLRSVRLRARAAAGQVVVSWPTNACDWMLQSTFSLAADTTWSDVTNDPLVVGNRFVITPPTDSTNTFFRLRSPSIGESMMKDRRRGGP